MTVREHLQAIYDKHGQLTPEIVVKEARNKNHPLHAHVFDRETKDAADAWYRHRAHELIQSARIVYRETEESSVTIRAFHAVRNEDGYVYEPTEKIVKDDFLARLVMADMEREWRQFKQRYETFREFWEFMRRELDQAA
jgi:hypothetical protein